MAKQLNSYQVNLQFTADSKQAQQQLKDLQEQLNNLTKNVNSYGNLSLSQEIQKALPYVSELQGMLVTCRTEAGTIDLGKFNQSLKKSGRTISEYGDQLQILGREGEQAFANLAKSISTAELPLKRSNALLKEFGTTLANTARWQISSSILHGFMGAIQSAYYYAQDLNESLNNVRIVTGQSADQMAKFAIQANKAAKELSTTTTKYTDAALIYYQQGLNDEQVKERTDITIKMANVARESAEIVSDQMTAVWNNFYDGSQSLEHYADAMVRLGADTASSSDEIAGGLEKFAAVANTIGLSFDNAAAALATITATTRQSEDVVGTALKTIFARIQGLKLGETLEDGTTLNQYSQALEKVGINIKDSNGELKDMDNIIEEMGNKWQSIDKDQQVALAQQVAGVRQYTQLIALMDHFDYYKENLTKAQDADGSLQEQADVYAESWEAAKNRVTASLETIYDQLLDDKAFIQLTNIFAKLLNVISQLIKALGGLPGVLSIIGTIGFKVFGNDITKSIQRMMYNIKISSKNGINEIVKMRQEANNKLRSIMADNVDQGPDYSTRSDIYTQQANLQDVLIQKQRELIAQGSQLTEEEQAQAKFIIDINEKLGERAIKSAQDLEQQQKITRQLERQLETQVRMKQGNVQDYRSQVNSTRQNFVLSSVLDDFQSATRDIENLDELKEKLQQVCDKTSQLGMSFNSLDNILNGTYNTTEEFRNQLNSLITITENEANSAFSQLRSTLEGTQMTEEQIENTINSLQDSYSSMVVEILNNVQATNRATDANQEYINTINSFSGVLPSAEAGVASFAQGLSSIAMAITSIKGIVDTWNNDEISIGDKLLSTVTALSIALPLLMNSLNKTSVANMGMLSSSLLTAVGLNGQALEQEALNLVTLKGVAAFKLAIKVFTKSLGPIALVGAAIGTLVFIIKSAIDEYNKADNNLKSASETVEKLTEKYNELTSSIEEFKNKANDYTTAVEALNGLDKKTQEYTDSLESANEKAKELIETYRLWDKYEIKDGLIVFDTGAIEEAQKKINDTANNIKVLQQSAKIDVESAKKEVSNTDLSRNIGKVKREGNSGTITNGEIELITQFAIEAQKESIKTHKSQDEILRQKLEKNTTFYSESIDKIMESSDAFFNLADSITEATKATDYYSNEILKSKNIQNNSGRVEKITDNTVLQDYIYAAEAGYQRQILKNSGKDFTNLTLPAHNNNADLNIDNDKELAKAYAREVLGLTEEELGQYIYSGGTGKGTLKNINGTVLFEDENDSYMREQIARKRATDEIFNSLENNDSYNLEEFDKSIENLLKKTEFFDKTFGANFSQAILDSLANAESGLDLTSILSELSPDQVEELKQLGSDGFAEALGLTKEQMESLGLNDGEAWLEGFENSLNNYNPDNYNQRIVDAAKTGEKNASNLISGLQSGDVTQENISSDEDYSNLIQQLEIIKKQYPELESAALELSHTWNAGSQTYYEALEQVQDKMAEIKLNDLNKDSDKLLKELQQNLQIINEKGVNVTVEADLSKFKDSMDELADQQYSINVEVHSQAEQEFNSITNAIKDMNTQASKIGSNYTVAADDIRELNNVFPGIIEGMTIAKDGSAQLKESIVKDCFDAAKAEIAADAEATVEQLNNQATLLEAKAVNYKNIAHLAEILATAENLSAQESAAIRSSISGNLAELESKNSKDTADTQADNQEIVANSSKDNAKVVAENWQKAFKSAAQNSVDFANTAINNMKKAVSGNGKGKLEGKFQVDYKGSTGVSAEAKVLEDAQKTLDKALADGENTSKETWAKIAATYNSLYASTMAQANDIRGMIASVGASVLKTDNAFKNLGKNASNTAKELQKVAERYHEITREIQYYQKLLDKLTDSKDKLYGKAKIDNINQEIEANKKLIDLQSQLYNLILANVAVDRQEVQKQFGGQAIFNKETLEIDNYTALYNKATTDKQREALEQYEETLDKLKEQEKALIDLKNTVQELHYEKLTYEVEVKIQLDENDTKKLEYYFDKLSDNIYKAAEALGYLQGQFDPVISQLGTYENFYGQLNNAYSNGEISQENYIEGLQDVYDNTLDNLNALQDLDKEMLEYYGNTIDLANDELSKYTDHMEHLTSVLDHYRSIITLLGKDKDYDKVLSVLNGTAQTKKNNFDASKQWYESLKRERDAAAAALANSTDEAEREVLQKNYDAILAAFDEAEEDMLSKAEEYGETLKEILTTKMEQAADEMNKQLSTTKVSINGNNFNISGWDALNDALDRMSSYQDEYLTKTNQIYEMNKLLNNVNQAIDKTNNQAAKNRYQQFTKEIEQLKDKDKLSQLELEIAQAKYKVLEAQIALEEAQNAKSTVRLQRDNEGNFGYVYTADQEKVNDAQQALADAENDLYNIRLNATNKYGQQKLQYEKELAEKLAELDQKAAEDAVYRETTYQQERALVIQQYTDLITTAGNLYAKAQEEDSRVVQDAWVNSFDIIKDNSNSWKDTITENTNIINDTFKEWQDSMDEISKIVGDDLKDTQQKVKDVTDESNKLYQEVSNRVIPALESELSSVRSATEAWAQHRQQLLDTIRAYEELLNAIQATLRAQSGFSGGSGNNSGNSDWSKNMGSVSYGSEEYYKYMQNREDKINGGYDVGAATNARVDAFYRKGLTLPVTRNGQTYHYFTDIPDSVWKQLVGFRSGGYTGTWNDGGKLAFLHQKELVLNADDTENMLASIQLVRQIAKQLDFNSQQISTLSSSGFTVSSQDGTLEQNVKIEASFPNATDRYEIQEAFNTLVNVASQYANRK